jgi:putative colanic acid biosynthesis UDP-glucose lipid carrier transferase
MNRNTGFQLGFPELKRSMASRKAPSYLELLWDFSARIIASIFLLCFLPIFGLIWLCFKCSGPGPMFFKQTRYGYKGTPFTIYKIRTMQIGAEKNTTLGTQNNSPEVTKLGRILRKMKIDEAPQLINIIRGDMALVGPRPIPTGLDAELRKKITGFHTRYNVKPGLTSIGQICVNENALGDALIKDWKLRFEGELHYIRNKSITYDLVLLSMTALYVLKKLVTR